jgi:hypothetical protein
MPPSWTSWGGEHRELQNAALERRVRVKGRAAFRARHHAQSYVVSAESAARPRDGQRLLIGMNSTLLTRVATTKADTIAYPSSRPRSGAPGGQRLWPAVATPASLTFPRGEKESPRGMSECRVANYIVAMMHRSCLRGLAITHPFFMVWVVFDAKRIGLGYKWGAFFIALSYIGVSIAFPVYLVTPERYVDSRSRLIEDVARRRRREPVTAPGRPRSPDPRYLALARFSLLGDSRYWRIRQRPRPDPSVHAAHVSDPGGHAVDPGLIGRPAGVDPPPQQRQHVVVLPHRRCGMPVIHRSRFGGQRPHLMAN